jgi:excisionase family DNA binding protein
MITKKGSEVMEYYTVKEVAELLKVHEQSVFRWLRLGKLESDKIGGVIRITQEQLDNFIKKGE